jgi:hypothetical protein
MSRRGYFKSHFPYVEDEVRFVMPVFLTGTLGTRDGAASNGVLVGAFTNTAVGAFLVDDGGVFSDDTTDANDAGAGDVAMFPATEAVNDAFYIGSPTKFSAVRLTLGTAGVGDTVVYEYRRNDNTWVNLATAHNLEDSSTGLTAGTSTYVISFTVPDDWAETTVGDGTTDYTGYLIRGRVTAASFTTIPLATQIWIYSLDAGVGLPAPLDGEIDGVGWNADTNSATNADSVFNIVNVTKGTAASFTLTGGTIAGHASLSERLYVDKGDAIVIQMVAEDGTTEFANVVLNLEII